MEQNSTQPQQARTSLSSTVMMQVPLVATGIRRVGLGLGALTVVKPSASAIVLATETRRVGLGLGALTVVKPSASAVEWVRDPEVLALAAKLVFRSVAGIDVVATLTESQTGWV